MTTKYGTFSEPGYLRPHAAASTTGALESKERRLSSMKIGGIRSGKVINSFKLRPVIQGALGSVFWASL